MVRLDPQIAIVLDGHASSPCEIGKPSLGADEDVINHGVGRRDLPVAVVPGQLCQLQNVERGISVVSERFFDLRAALAAAVGSTCWNGH